MSKVDWKLLNETTYVCASRGLVAQKTTCTDSSSEAPTWPGYWVFDGKGLVGLFEHRLPTEKRLEKEIAKRGAR